MARVGVVAQIVADVHDMAMIRLLAREDPGLAVTPLVVPTDEIASDRPQTAPFDLGLMESFYTVTVPHPAPEQLLSNAPAT